MRRFEEALHFERLALELEKEAGADGYNALIGIADKELLLGNVDAAIATGTELVAMIEGSRDEHQLAHARVNLAAAWLAAGDPVQARVILVAAWPLALRFDFHPWCAEYMALLAAMQGRTRTAARLAGSADARYSTANEHRHANEATARRQTRTIAVGQLGEPEFERLKVAGRSLSNEGTAELALGTKDG